MILAFVALVMELTIPLLSLEWLEYSAISEFRLLFWIATAFYLSRRLPVNVRSVLLFIALCQAWTFTVYFAFLFGVEISGYFIHAGSVSAVMVCLWLFLRDFEKPSTAVNIQSIDKNGCYFIIREPTASYLMDVVCSLFGVPASSVSVYLSGSVYAFNSESHRYEVKKNCNIKKMNRYAIKIDIGNTDEAHIILSEKLGSKYKPVRCNCVGVLRSFCKHVGIPLNPLQRTIPGLFVAKLVKAMS